MKKDASDESESDLSVTLAATSSLASVFVFNCTALNITAFNVNNVNVAPQGIGGISTLAGPPAYVQASRNVFGTNPVISATFDGNTRPSWTVPITIPQMSMINIYLWCYLNGFILADQYGTISYMYGQSSVSAELASASDEWPETGRIISVAL